ncbi:TlpA family protein disulfide reductase [Calidifontibacter indicus]|uniref:Thiol-disulfide isomerase/thioredoxin n=1 Tax=Calidifontibacter indicus TaxID=419650 RepID=A0A3D9UVR8_9MICO|nr:TlpA disulfide reductase family protein [Calidifontibacter indicus]REF30094.1 thiol-disulfide isomerase/thioredoxin [Calidifontibacter indicus]
MSASRRTVLTALGGMFATATLAACSSDPNSVSAQANKGDSKGYVAGDGTIEQLAVSQRGKPVQLDGTLLDGKTWSSSSADGKVVVLNVWGAWCPPCQNELPHLQSAWAGWQAAGQPVVMLGINQRDSVQRAQATLAKLKVTYPSLAEDGGKALLSLQGKVRAYPTTLVLDKEHRIAARVSGEVTEATLKGLVDDVLKSA